jgi:hypothetical protein
VKSRDPGRARVARTEQRRHNAYDLELHDKPEAFLEGLLARLVVKKLLRRESAGTSANKAQKQEPAFGHTPHILSRLFFVEPVGRKGDRVDGWQVEQKKDSDHPDERQGLFEYLAQRLAKPYQP